jgi:NADP-dependent 3-hydroxy acid dehydrogenase YdfG
MPKGTQMTEFNSDENLSAHDIKRHYGAALGEAERIINWFSPSTNEEVVLHARSLERAQSNIDKNGGSPSFVIGDLSDATAVRAIADQVNEIGRMDAVIHNAGIYLEHGRGNTIEGHAKNVGG